MNHDGRIMLIGDIYKLSYNKYLSCLTRPYYDPRFVVNTIYNYVKNYVVDRNELLEGYKQSITFDQLFEEFCKQNLDLDTKYIDNAFEFVAKYGKLQKILKNVPSKRYRDIYNLRQWICQCRYICNKTDNVYNIGLEMALIIYYIKLGTKDEVINIYKDLKNAGIFGEDLDVEPHHIELILKGCKESEYLNTLHLIFKAAVVLPPAACDLTFHAVNCFINKRSLPKSNYISFIHKVSSYTLSKGQSNPIYKQVFAEELQKEQNIIIKERNKIVNSSTNKWGYWLSDSMICNILSVRYSQNTIWNYDFQERIKKRLRNARKLGMVSNTGYTPLMEFLTLLTGINGLNQEMLDVIFVDTLNTALFKHGYNILESDVMYYLRRYDKGNKVSDDVEEVIRYCAYDVPPIDLVEWVQYMRKHGNDGKMAAMSQANFTQTIIDICYKYINFKHPVQASKLYCKAYAKDLERARTHVWGPLAINKEGVIARAIK